MRQLHLSDLSLGELERVQTTLERRFGIGKRGNVVQLGFGVAEFETRGQLDEDRPEAICFYVSRKTKTEPRDRRDRIPAEIRIRIRRGSTFCQLVAPTDVIVVKRSQCVLSGRVIRYGDWGAATTGVLLVWRPRGRTRLTWAVMSVGHSFPRNLPIPDQEVAVQIEGMPPIPGRFLARGSNYHLDTSLTIVRKSDLISAGVIPARFRPTGIVVRTVANLRRDVGVIGTTLPRSVPINYQVQRFLLSAPVFRSKLGFTPKHVLHVGRAARDTFEVGTSGSAWRITRQAAAIQFGSYLPRFDEGFGHSLETAMEWVPIAVGEILGVRESEVEVRAVAVF